jgi:dolichol kinase
MILPELVGDWRSRLVREMRRKAIHLTGLSVPVALILFGREFTTAAIALVLAASIMIEILRLQGRIRLPEVRDHEKNHVAGYIYYMAGSLLTVYFFPPAIAITAMLFLALGDTVSGLSGSVLKDCDVRTKPTAGDRRIGWRVKPLPVLACTFFACLAIGALASGFTGLSWPVYLAGAATAAFVDGVAIIVHGIGLDDNFGIPVLSAAIMSAVTLGLNIWN